MHECLLFCDFHGHSIKRDVFLYGCNMKPLEPEQNKKNIMARLVPYILAKKNKLVSYKNCRFRMQKSKESTARIVVYKQFGILNSFTMEASFYGPTSLDSFREPRTDYHMLLSDLRGIGRDLCMSCLNYISPSIFVKNLYELSNLIRETLGLKYKTLTTDENIKEKRLQRTGFQKSMINDTEV